MPPTQTTTPSICALLLFCASSLGTLRAQDQPDQDPLSQASRALWLGDYETALEAVHEAGSAEPSNAALRLLHIAVLIKAGKQSVAQDAVEAWLAEGDVEERSVLMTLDSALARTQSSRTDSVLDSLLEAVQHERAQGRPERMLPLLVSAERLMPRDWRVQMGLGEAYGGPWVFFSPRLAEDSFRKLLQSLPPDPSTPSEDEARRAAELAQFARRPQEGLIQQLRPVLYEYLDSLARGKPIRIWMRTWADHEATYEKIIVERSLGNQQAVVDLAESLVEQDPGNPVAHYLLGIATGSFGPAFDGTVAIQSFEKFLDLTHAAASERRGGEETNPSGASVAEPALSLDRETFADLLRSIGLNEARDALGEQRLQVRFWMKRIRRGEPILVAPDLKALERRIGQLQRRIERLDKDKTEQEATLSEAQSKLKYWESVYDQERQRPLRRGETFRDLQRLVDNIAVCKRKIRRCERKLKTIVPDLDELKSEMARIEPVYRSLGS